MDNNVNEENSVVQGSNDLNNNKKFNLNYKIITIICAVLLLIVSIVLVVVLTKDSLNNDGNNGKNDKNETENKEPVSNTNPGVIDDKEQDGLKFTNASLVSTDHGAELTTLVQNTTDSDIEVRVFDILVKDKDGNLIVKLTGYVGEKIPAGEFREVECSVDMNLSHATDIEYKLVK